MVQVHNIPPSPSSVPAYCERNVLLDGVKFTLTLTSDPEGKSHILLVSDMLRDIRDERIFREDLDSVKLDRARPMLVKIASDLGKDGHKTMLIESLSSLSVHPASQAVFEQISDYLSTLERKTPRA